MEDQRYAIVQNSDNVVVNVVMWNGDTGPTGWQPPEGTFVIQTEIGNIGDTYNPDDGSFTPPPPENP